MTKWMLRQAAVNVGQLAAEWGVSPVLAHILAVRGFRAKEEVESFLRASTMQLPAPQILADMPQALELISQAIKSGQQIAIFGDYDADGICSTVILYKTLISLKANVIYYIPQRENEGYGLNNEAILCLKQKQVDIILACDNGVSAFEQVLYANALGMSVIILDHHDLPLNEEREQVLAAAAALVNAKRTDSLYPFRFYCAAGLCYRFSQALYEYFNSEWQNLGQELLPFAALATICDLVELCGENRYLVQKGLPAIAATNNQGLKALLAATGLSGQDISAYHVGFRLGPCINASGRLQDAALAVELFLTADEARATAMAVHLTGLNETRKTLTEQGTKLALKTIENQGLNNDKIIIVHCPELHESVAGIIAGKLKEHFYKPVIVVAGDKETVRGSGRSIEAYHMYQGLSACQELFINFGGHPMAAGFSIPLANVLLLRERLNRECNLTVDDMQLVRRVDKLMPLSEINLQLARELQTFEPFGKGNSPIYFAEKGVKLLKISLLGANGQVLRLNLQSPSMNNPLEAVCFDGKEKLYKLLQTEYNENCWNNLIKGITSDVNLDILYTVNINNYQGRQSAQVQIVDFRASR